MPKPLDHRQLKFAQGLLSGKSQADAYRDAGYIPNVARACNLARNKAVVAYLEEQRKAASEAVQVDLRWWLERNVMEAMGQIEATKLDQHGNEVTITDCTPASRAAALDRLGKHLGAYKQDAPNPYSESAIAELLRRLPEAVDVLGYRLVPKDARVVDGDK